jgi:arginase
MQTQSANTQGLAILGVPSGLGQLRPGLEFGPKALRSTGILKDFFHLGWKPADLGDVAPCDAGGDAWSVIDRVKTLSDAAMRRYGRMLLLGGDHSVSVGSIRAALSVHPDLKVIWVDAHGDMNTPETSPTGNLHGMPLASLLGLFRKQDRHPVLLPENLCLVGVRALDPAEADLIARTGIQVATVTQVKEKGIAKVLSDFGVITGRQPIHLSFDIDALDPSEASATGIHVADGLLAP